MVAYEPDTEWSQGGPISEREGIAAEKFDDHHWRAKTFVVVSPYTATADAVIRHVREDGPTELVAKMRCFVASRLGDVVEIPEELE